MEAEIKKIIEQHLPTQTAGVLKDYLEGAELTERVLRETQATVTKHEETIAEYVKREDLLADAERQVATAVAIRKQNEERTIKLDEEARNMRCTIMETQLSMTTANMKNMESLVQKVFGHPSVSITRQVPVAAGFNNADGSYNSGDMLENASEKTVEGKD
jgi:hypothetical protein